MSSVFYKLVDNWENSFIIEAMDKLTIEQLTEVLDISRPTALKLAQAHGHKVDETPRGKWLVPADVVRKIITYEIALAYGKEARFNEVVLQEVNNENN